MNAIKTIQAKNGQTYYYLGGKRISQAKALAILADAPQADAPQADAPQADAPQAQIMPSSLPRFDFVVKQTDYVVRQELLAQRTHYISQRADKAKATLKGMCKVSALMFLIVAIAALMGIISSAVTIASISALLAVSAPLMLMSYRSYMDTVDKIHAEQESCLLKIGEYADAHKHLSAFTQSKVGNYNCSKLLAGI